VLFKISGYKVDTVMKKLPLDLQEAQKPFTGRRRTPMKKALLIVDMQNDFCPGGALPVLEGDEIIPAINILQEEFDMILATVDWHPYNHMSFASTYADKKVGDVIILQGIEQVLWPMHCVQFTVGAAFPPELDISRFNYVFPKAYHRDMECYSGFMDIARKKSTGLFEALQTALVTDVHIVGLATDYCVKATALDAIKLGLKTTVILTECRGIHPDTIEAAYQQMEKAGVILHY